MTSKAIGRSDRMQNGMTITAALPQIISSLEDVSSIRLLRLTYPPPLSERLADQSPGAGIVRRGLDFAGQHGLPFWLSVLLKTHDSDTDVPRGLLEAARLHRTATSPVQSETVRAKEVTPESLQRRIDELEDNEFLAITSQVLTRKGKSMHLPLLDLSVPHSARNTELARHMLALLGIPGVLVQTSHSYHFYGTALQPDNEYLRAFLGSALLFAPITDQRWIAHQLLDGLAVLALVGRSQPRRVPTVVAAIEP